MVYREAQSFILIIRYVFKNPGRKLLFLSIICLVFSLGDALIEKWTVTKAMQNLEETALPADSILISSAIIDLWEGERCLQCGIDGFLLIESTLEPTAFYSFFADSFGPILYIDNGNLFFVRSDGLSESWGDGFEDRQEERLINTFGSYKSTEGENMYVIWDGLDFNPTWWRSAFED